MNHRNGYRSSSCNASTDHASDSVLRPQLTWLLPQTAYAGTCLARHTCQCAIQNGPSSLCMPPLLGSPCLLCPTFVDHETWTGLSVGPDLAPALGPISGDRQSCLQSEYHQLVPQFLRLELCTTGIGSSLLIQLRVVLCQHRGLKVAVQVILVDEVWDAGFERSGLQIPSKQRLHKVCILSNGGADDLATILE
jgi:hypothetical protein